MRIKSSTTDEQPTPSPLPPLKARAVSQFSSNKRGARRKPKQHQPLQKWNLNLLDFITAHLVVETLHELQQQWTLNTSRCRRHRAICYNASTLTYVCCWMKSLQTPARQLTNWTTGKGRSQQIRWINCYRKGDSWKLSGCVEEMLKLINN